MHRLLLALFAGLVASVAPSAHAQEGSGERALPTVEEVMDHLDDLYRAQSSHAEMTMEIVTDRYERTLTMESWSRGDGMAVIVVRAPAREAGTATLKTDEGLWNYAPRADRLMRIPSGLMSDGWMGSHITNEDVMRESDYVDDYETTLSWTEEDGRRFLVATSIPGPSAAVVYTRIVYVMEPDIYTPRRAEFFEGDELVRTMRYDDVREVGGMQVPHVMEVLPADAPGEHTRIRYATLEFDVDIDESLFSQRGLRRVAQQ